MPTSLSRDRLDDLLAAAATQRVTIVGDAMLDVYLRGDVDRISPEAPVPVVRVRERKDALGGAANVAQNVAALGAGCALVATSSPASSAVTGTRTRQAMPGRPCPSHPMPVTLTACPSPRRGRRPSTRRRPRPVE